MRNDPQIGRGQGHMTYFLNFGTSDSMAPKTITDELQRVLNAAARLISCTGKYNHGLSTLLHNELHWLDIPQRVQYKLAVTIHRYLRSPESSTDVPHGHRLMQARSVSWLDVVRGD